MAKVETEEDLWDVAPPNTPLNIDWPLLRKKEDKIQASKKIKKDSWAKYKKHRKQKRLEMKPAPKRDLDKSLFITTEEYEKFNQLVSMFENLDLSVIITVLRGAESDLEKAIEQLLVLNEAYEAYEAEKRKEQEVTEENASNSEGDENELPFRESALDCDDFADLVDENEEESSDLDFWSEDSKTYQSDDDKKLDVSGQMTPKSNESMETYRILGEYIKLPPVPSSDSEVEKWLKEFDSSYSRRSLHASTDSTGEIKPFQESSDMNDSLIPISISAFSNSMLESIPDIDLNVNSPSISPRSDSLFEMNSSSSSSFSSSSSSLPIMDTKGVSLNDILLEVKPLVTNESEKEEERPYLFALDEDSNGRKEIAQEKAERRHNALIRRQEKKMYRQRNKLTRIFQNAISKETGTISIHHPVVSIGLDAKESIQNVSLSFHQEQINRLEEEKNQVIEEKKRAMSWCVEQIQLIQRQNLEKDTLCENQLKEMEAQKLEIENLRQQIIEMKLRENKVHSVIDSSKETILDKMNSLKTNITEALSKVTNSDKLEAIEKVKEEWIEKVNEIDFLDSMKNFASTIKVELSSIVSSIESSIHRALESKEKEEVKEEKEESEEDFEEEKEIWKAERASLESYIEELKSYIQKLEEMQKFELKPPPQEKETQVERTPTKVQETNTSVSPYLTSDGINNTYSDSYRFFQQQYQEQWKSEFE